MWLVKPKPTQRQPSEDAVEWARRETWAFTIWKCKVYGALLGINVALAALTVKGMPLHGLWRWLGIPLVLSFAYLFSAFGFYATAAIGEVVGKSRSSSRSHLR